MTLRRDDELFEQLRQRPDNLAVLALVETSSAHGDLGAVLFDYAKTTGGLRVVPVANVDFPAPVATPPDSEVIIAAATGMRQLLLRAGDQPPDGARLRHERLTEAGPGWWQVDPFDPDLSRAVTTLELQRWFSAARNSQ